MFVLPMNDNDTLDGGIKLWNTTGSGAKGLAVNPGSTSSVYSWVNKSLHLALKW